MIYEAFSDSIEEALGYPFTAKQREAALLLAKFILRPQPSSAFILRGYAGTGKTSLIGALVHVLKKLEQRVCLLAPTGRAAKVFSLHAHQRATTIHKEVYRQDTFNGEDTHFSLGYNDLRDTLFIVDEASMVSNRLGSGSIFGTGFLLDDLIQYVYNAPGCRLLFVGDNAQLPPVGELDSPALSAEQIKGYGLVVEEVQLTEIVRQASASDVLSAATLLRHHICTDNPQSPILQVNHKGEVRYLPGGELLEALEDAYSEVGADATIVVTRSNKRANAYNVGIRNRLFDREEELTRGDLVMAVKNNYFWTKQLLESKEMEERPPFDFIANGERAEVKYIRNMHEQYGFRFADVSLSFPDYEDYEMECRVILDTLIAEAPSLTAEQQLLLFERVEEDYAHITSRRKRLEALRKDAYYNALQLKYAYAVTCHKAQGGQWERVFVDQGMLPPNMDPIAHLRWLYTAVTRTTDRLYLVNWPKSNFVEVNED